MKTTKSFLMDGSLLKYVCLISATLFFLMLAISSYRQDFYLIPGTDLLVISIIVSGLLTLLVTILIEYLSPSRKDKVPDESNASKTWKDIINIIVFIISSFSLVALIVYFTGFLVIRIENAHTRFLVLLPREWKLAFTAMTVVMLLLIIKNLIADLKEEKEVSEKVIEVSEKVIEVSKKENESQSGEESDTLVNKD